MNLAWQSLTDDPAQEAWVRTYLPFDPEQSLYLEIGDEEPAVVRRVRGNDFEYQVPFALLAAAEDQGRLVDWSMELYQDFHSYWATKKGLPPPPPLPPRGH